MVSFLQDHCIHYIYSFLFDTLNRGYSLDHMVLYLLFSLVYSKYYILSLSSIIRSYFLFSASRSKTFTLPFSTPSPRISCRFLGCLLQLCHKYVISFPRFISINPLSYFTTLTIFLYPFRIQNANASIFRVPTFNRIVVYLLFFISSSNTL